MAEAGNDSGAAAAAGGQPNLSVLVQYVTEPAQPAINVSIGVQANQLTTDQVEVELRVEARGIAGQTVLFATELVYAGVFRFSNIPADNARPVALIECPRLLFPFARQIIAEATRNGGFPPLMIDPVDFVAIYRQQLEAQAAQPRPTLS
jgi:preprotein translocase subunit SecB